MPIRELVRESLELERFVTEASVERRPDLSLAMVTMNSRRLLQACLESLRALPDALDWELILADNGSSDGSPELAAEILPSVRLIRNSSNTGFAHASNQGLKAARGRYVMLLNDDTVIRPHAFDRLVSFMDQHPEVGACGPKLWYPDGRHQPSCFTFHTPWRHLCHMLDLGKLFPRSRIFADQSEWFDHQRTAPADWLMGAAILVRREVLEKVGLLDEQFRIHCNEVDWCYRIHKAGWAIYFVHDAEIEHHCGATIRSDANRIALQGEVVRNTIDYYAKHYGGWGVLWYRYWTVVGFTLRAGKYALVNALRPSEASRNLGRFCRGMVRAGWTGNPYQFTPAPAKIG